MEDLEMLYFKEEMRDIKDFCIRHKKVIKYQNRPYYLYDKTIYDKDMNIVIEYAENGFLDLFEYFEDFEQNI